MEKLIIVLLFAWLLLSCGNKSREKERVFLDSVPAIEEAEHVTVAVAIPEEEPKMEEKHSTSAGSSSPRSRKYSSDDNMRGFDPASEDDMEDNGMSRYMDNNDEEGWD